MNKIDVEYLALERKELEKLAAVYRELGLADRVAEIESVLEGALFSEAATRSPAENREVEDAVSTAESLIAEWEKVRRDLGEVTVPALQKMERAHAVNGLSESDRNLLAGYYQKLKGIANLLNL